MVASGRALVLVFSFLVKYGSLLNFEFSHLYYVFCYTHTCSIGPPFEAYTKTVIPAHLSPFNLGSYVSGTIATQRRVYNISHRAEFLESTPSPSNLFPANIRHRNAREQFSTRPDDTKTRSVKRQKRESERKRERKREGSLLSSPPLELLYGITSRLCYCLLACCAPPTFPKSYQQTFLVPPDPPS